ncbi:MAG TPA: GNAT family N-acetyltransferase [Pyrinomonadaceae bacterium]|jgi:GNAT superfamily N-acetyltransferase|nr:GNAT family N-acetyltransferase [Pyrinomonadaceae bacterium]
MSNNVNVSLRPVTDADQEFLVGVYASTRAAELAQVNWDESQKDAFVRWQFALQRQEYDTRYPDARYDVILVDGVPAGRIWVGTDDTQIRLLDIALLTEFQNRGVGAYLLQQLIGEAKRANKPLRHMVFMLNDNAHRFYERLGFVTIEDVGGYKHMEWRAEQNQSSSAG